MSEEGGKRRRASERGRPHEIHVAEKFAGPIIVVPEGVLVIVRRMLPEEV